MRSYAPGELVVHRSPDELARVTRALRRTGRPVVLVPTMGALHAGHRELVRAARRDRGAVVVVSIFVNPLQFGPTEDLDRYPRRLAADLDLLAAEGVELVLAPSVPDVHPPGADTRVLPGPLGDELEGAARPGHFAGVLTVVAKLFGIVGPDRAYFGEKDYQQLVLVDRMARDLHLGVQVVGVPTVREPDGLALSSRNAYLTPAQRRAAVVLSAALTAGAHSGPDGADRVLAVARDVLAGEPSIAVDYLALRSRGLGPPPADGEARLLVAATAGTTRLIDNVGVRLGARDPERSAGPVQQAGPARTPGRGE